MNATAAVLTAPRTFEIRELPIPEIGPDDGLLRVEACGLCGSDYEQWTGELGEFAVRPIIPGHEIIGHIERGGAPALKAWGFKEGDRVALEGVIPCGVCPACTSGVFKRCVRKRGYGLRLGTETAPGLWGGYSTHVYLERGALLHRLPDHVPAATMVLFNPLSNGVRWTCEVGGVVLGSTVVITGPGQRGLLCVVAAREAGAREIIITGTKNDKARLALARELGATATVDISVDDPIEVVRERTGGKGVDVVVEVSAGATEPILQAIEMVRPGGRIVLGGLKSGKPTSIITDKLAFKEITMVGVFSAGWSAIETAIGIIDRNADELAKLCTHSFPIAQAEKAVRLVGREITDVREPINIHLTP